MRVIALEEHFSAPRVAEATGARWGAAGADLQARLTDLSSGRLADMDDHGIDVQVISHTQPGTQLLDPAVAVPLAAEANDRLAAAVAEHPGRFAGFATLPTGEPGAAADELERTVADHGFVGALINGHTNGAFLDDPSFEPLLARAERLGVPLYVHPAEPVDSVRDAYYGGLGPAVGWALSAAGWGWHAEAGLHALRLILAGVFDRHPHLQIILGHMGEMLPVMLARVDDIFASVDTGLARRPSEYFLANFHITTSGIFTIPPFLAALLVVGIDRMLFSVDYPYASNARGRAFLDAAPLDPADKEKLASGNAARLLGLGT